MQERAKSLKTSLNVEARPKQGTVVSFEFNH